MDWVATGSVLILNIGMVAYIYHSMGSIKWQVVEIRHRLQRIEEQFELNIKRRN